MKSLGIDASKLVPGQEVVLRVVIEAWGDNVAICIPEPLMRAAGWSPDRQYR
jgi:hypothetical protein